MSDPKSFEGKRFKLFRIHPNIHHLQHPKAHRQQQIRATRQPWSLSMCWKKKSSNKLTPKLNECVKFSQESLLSMETDQLKSSSSP